MPSPFPGMDPYLEAHWRDVHASLIIYARDALQEVLPSSLLARVEERVVLETPEGWGEHDYYPDVRIVEYKSEPGQLRHSPGTTAAKPLVLLAEVEQITETLIEVIDVESGN